MNQTVIKRASAPATPGERQVLLHVGCGPKGPRQLHPLFRDEARWQEIRVDLDPAVKPDIVCSSVDMRAHVPDASVDALWSSHNIEHLFDHEVPLALAEVRRVLKPTGYALFRCPDLTAILEAIRTKGLEETAYVSPAGPITPLDMLFGFRKAIAQGHRLMAHHNAFTDERMARLLIEAGFAEARTRRDAGFDLWSLALREEAPVESILAALASHGLSFME